MDPPTRSENIKPVATTADNRGTTLVQGGQDRRILERKQ
jgi:hypothetical protein